MVGDGNARTNGHLGSKKSHNATRKFRSTKAPFLIEVI